MKVNHLIEIDFDTCSNTFGSAPCAAVNATGFECYNTKATCQDEANFARSTKTVTLSEHGNEVYPGAVPCVESIEFAPTEINPKEGLDYLGKLKIKVKDFAHHDRGQDPYVSTRPYIASDQGTFWGKLLARNPHYFGRKIRVKRVVDGVVVQTYLFVLESITPPDSRGQVKIVARDPLFLAGGDKAKAPKASSGELAADISDSATSLALDDATAYPASGTIRINNEVMDYTGKAGNNLTGLSRGQWGTSASTHSTEANVQLCLAYTNEPIIDVINDLITNYTPIDNTFVPYADWTTEQTDWLSVYTLTNVISEPTDVLDLLTQIQVETGTVIWWDQEDQAIQLKTSVPRTQNQNIELLTDRQHLMQNVEVEEQASERISQVWMYYGIQDYTGTDEAKNYSNLEIRADLGSEGADEYGTEKIEVVYSRWLTGVAQVGQVASRKLARYRNPPKLISFSLDSKDSALRTGDHFYLQTASIQSKTGAPLDVEMQMLSMRYFAKSMSFRCKAQTFNYLLNEIYAYVAPNATPDYSAASEAEKSQYGFICQDNGKFATGEDGYLII